MRPPHAQPVFFWTCYQWLTQKFCSVMPTAPKGDVPMPCHKNLLIKKSKSKHSFLCWLRSFRGRSEFNLPRFGLRLTRMDTRSQPSFVKPMRATTKKYDKWGNTLSDFLSSFPLTFWASVSVSAMSADCNVISLLVTMFLCSSFASGMPFKV